MEKAMPLQLANLLQFQQSQRCWHFVPSLDDALRSALLGLDETSYRTSKKQCESVVREAAEQLLAERALAEGVDRLPFATGATVIGVGDSLTDDFQSWLEILRHLLELRRPHDAIRIVNAARGGQTTTRLLGRFLATLEQRPEWLLCCIGVNDAVRIGSPQSKTLVSVEETARNLTTLGQLAAPIGSRWVWLTPPTIHEERLAANPVLLSLQLSWRNEDLEAVGAVVRRQAGVVVDVQALFGRPVDPAFLLPDGIHPSLSGHKAIVRALVERLTA